MTNSLRNAQYDLVRYYVGITTLLKKLYDNKNIIIIMITRVWLITFSYS